MLAKTIIHAVVCLVLCLTFSAMIGCKKSEAPAPATPAEAQAAIQDAFKQASPELKAAADETAVGLLDLRFNVAARALPHQHALGKNTPQAVPARLPTL